ncbi:nuclease [Artemisia annua]|uniref:Nuclease n=1 Tax=Artemisia annua TaxID=35608 RepID=A0A2U1M626_ARTAN|nr:nuclease [Artemisia annua]
MPIEWRCYKKVCIVLEGVDKYSNLIGSVYYSDGETAKDLAMELIENVKEAKGEVSPEHAGAAKAYIRNLPPSAVGDPSNLDAMGLLASNKGKPMEAIVEKVRDGSSLHVYLLPEFQFVQVFVAGIQAPSMGRRTTQEPALPIEVPSDEPNGDSNTESHGPLTSAQRVTTSSSFTEVSPDAFGREAKHFTEIRVLNRDEAERAKFIVEKAEQDKRHAIIRYYCGSEHVPGWAKSRLVMYSSSGVIPNSKDGLGTSSTSSNSICFGHVI